MSDPDFAVFDMPIQMAGHLAGDPQFDGMTRKFRIGRAAVTKAIAPVSLNLSAQELYDEFYFDIWMTVKDEVWSRKPVGGFIDIEPDDLNE